MTLRLSYLAHSEVGLVRKNNQDSGYTSPTMLVVADGMGGAAAGDLASAVAIAEVQDADAELRAAAHAEQDGPSGATPDGDAEPVPTDVADEPIEAAEITLEPPQMLDVLAGIVERANRRIADLVAADPTLDGMGTTVDAMMFDGQDLALAHIGDSRAYLLRDGTLTRLTHDHSWVQSLIDEGRISLEEAAYHPHRSLLLKVLNGQTSNDPDLSTHRMRAGDRLLLCSDGLCGLVEDEVLGPLLASPDPATALERLVSEAHAEGGIDNITLIIADLVEAGADDEVPDVMVLGAAGSLDIPALDAAGATGVPPRAALPGDVEDDGSSPSTPVAGRSAGSPASASTPVRPQASPDEREEADRYALQTPPPTRRRVLRIVLSAVLALVVLGGAAFGALVWGRTQYYVGAADQSIAIYQGLPESLGPVSLNRVFEVQPTRLADLPLLYQDQVRTTIETRSLADARRTVAELADVSEECIRQREERAQQEQPPEPSPSPAPGQTPAPGDSPSPAPPGDGSC